MTPRDATAMLLLMARMCERVARDEASRVQTTAWGRADAWQAECLRLEAELAAADGATEDDSPQPRASETHPD